MESAGEILNLRRMKSTTTCWVSVLMRDKVQVYCDWLGSSNSRVRWMRCDTVEWIPHHDELPWCACDGWCRRYTGVAASGKSKINPNGCLNFNLS